MGRTTRVFGARVLRSGRRVWTGPPLETISDGKTNHCSRDSARGGAAPAVAGPGAGPVNDDEELVGLKNEDDEAVGAHHYKQGKATARRLWKTGKNNADIGNEMTMVVDIKENIDEREPEPVRPEYAKAEQNNEVQEAVDRMFGIVYKRKRKREKEQVDGDGESLRQFVRRRMAGTFSGGFVPGSCDYSKAYSELLRWGRSHRKLALVVGCCAGRSVGCVSSYRIFSRLLNSLLRYMRRVKLGLQPLVAFICSEPIVNVYSAHGISFVQDFSSVGNAGVCIISGAKSSIPAFSVEFSALPFCFMHLHSSLLLHYAVLLCILERNSRSSYGEEDKSNSVNKFSSSVLPSGGNQVGCEGVVSKNDTTGKTEEVPELRMPKSVCRTINISNGRKIQKRSSLKKRGRPPSILRMQKANGALSSDLLRSKHDRIQLSPQGTTRQLRSTTRGTSRNVLTIVKEFKSNFLEMTENIGTSSCLANMLVIESDKCYRVEGTLITLELSESNRWCLTIRKDGIKRYSFTAQKFMRPSGSNRFTHDTIWTRDNDWKLEFPNRQDWLIFRELYKACYERNLQIPVPSFIPVPRVREVQNYGENQSLLFVRPDSYITMKDDELARLSVKRTAAYDMDSDDDDWLYKFNAESELHDLLSDENFELMIDAFEKAVHCNPEDFCNKEAACSIFPDLGRRSVEAVYNHWIRKRKLKRAALVRVYQCYQPRKAQLILNSIFRKKRSFKRQGNQAGRSKQRTFLHAIAAERDDAEQHDAIVRAEEATAAANRTESLAVLKRQRAQQLMENADLAAYKAMMALKIAEAAQHTESTNDAVSFFLG